MKVNDINPRETLSNFGARVENLETQMKDCTEMSEENLQNSIVQDKRIDTLDRRIEDTTPCRECETELDLTPWDSLRLGTGLMPSLLVLLVCTFAPGNLQSMPSIALE